jgi:hypothetical protein
MSTPRAGPPIPSDEQLADILRFIARSCLEVERGLRPPRHLLKLMDPNTGLRWSKTGKIGRFHGGPVQDDQIGEPHFTRLADGEAVVATVVTRTEGDRWGAITLRLQADDKRRWRIADLQRLQAATHYRAGPSQPTVPEVPAARRLAFVADDRRMAKAAHQAITRRLSDLTRGAPGYRATRDLVRYWTNKLAELDRELADLKQRYDTRQQIHQLFRR